MHKQHGSRAKTYPPPTNRWEIDIQTQTWRHSLRWKHYHGDGSEGKGGLSASYGN